MEWFTFAIGSAILASGSAILEKDILFKEKGLDFAFLLALLNLFLSIPLIFFINFDFPLHYIVYAYFASLLGSLAFWSITHALRRMDISVVSPLKNIEPLFLMFLAFLLLGEALTIKQGVGVFLMVFGLYVLESHRHERVLDPFKRMIKSKYLKFVILSAGLYAFASIFDKIVLKVMEPTTYVFIIHVFLAFNFTMFVVAKRRSFDKIVQRAKPVWKLFVFASILTIGYRLLQMQAVSMAFVSLVIPIRRLDTLFTTVIGGELFHEQGMFRKIISVIIMIFASYLIIGF